ncbi:MAG TPA: penicillin acylase family protein [Allosphingosinicella sp.]|uniref:penicillin acylase family protein n=1 Tax=Allosphingosinicella sp. TaxID=2823234 RepID=UPI002F2AA2E7
MRALSFLLIPLALAGCATPRAGGVEPAGLAAQAQRVTITRDDWGIAHIRGRTDADAVFGMIYAQAEDDFNRIETNYLVQLGRLAEAEGEKAIWQDLRMRLFNDGADLRTRYAASPQWLQRLMTAWADGLNYYLATHPETRPRVLTRFEPWMALSFTEGSIGADFERVSLADLEAFYGKPRGPVLARQDPVRQKDPTGSNGIAIAPAITTGGNALLLINPHTSFFFRSEQQVTSEEGLNAYGASTWGQFFIYQGFNDRLGWMHTTSGLDAVDEFAETIFRQDDRILYRHGAELRPVETRTIAIPYRSSDGSLSTRSFKTYRTHHGPVIRSENGKWISIALMHKPVEALSQSYLRTKARSFDQFLRAAEYKANSSNNTIYADADGNIAYLHPQFAPVRDDRYDYTKPVDGSDPRTDWRGVHEVRDLPSLRSPPTGWIQNTNNWPYSAAGPHSPREKAFPRYMDTFGENVRGLHALQLLGSRRGWTLDGLVTAAYDSFQPAFAQLVPGLIAAHDAAPRTDPLKRRLAEPIAALRGWDHRWGVDSVPTSLAVFWADHLFETLPRDVRSRGNQVPAYMANETSPEQKLRAFAAAVERLERDFGSWRTPWGEINRFQRLTGDIDQPFSDAAPSIPVGFTSGAWGSLASFGASRQDGSRRYYGLRGNSFVAAVEFGRRIRARAVSAGGQSGDPRSPHFNDQALRYATGDLREVYFYPDQLRGHTKRVYKPGL